ncbi:MAG: hypothetical protein U9Q15_00850 [Patescibacteria group bacterium]|nr:hypothetical protein [Patescibacteria group bacterium]
MYHNIFVDTEKKTENLEEIHQQYQDEIPKIEEIVANPRDKDDCSRLGNSDLCTTTVIFSQALSE